MPPYGKFSLTHSYSKSERWMLALHWINCILFSLLHEEFYTVPNAQWMVSYISALKEIHKIFLPWIEAILKICNISTKTVTSSIQNICQTKKSGLSYANQFYILTKWEITDLDLLQIEKYTLADRWSLKFFLNCLNACFFGNLTNTGKRESRGEGRGGDGRF